MGKMDGQKVVVIGGTQGIGLAVAQQARDEGGRVWAVSRSQEKVAAAAADHPDISFSSLDIHDAKALQALFAETGAVDHIAACATGADRTMAPFLEQTDEQFREAFNKFWGYANVARQGVPHLTERGSITFVSGFPARKSNPGMSSLSTTGNAVEGFSRALAIEIAPRRANVVAPGSIATPMFGYTGGDLPEALQQMGKRIPLGRVGFAEEVAQAILLCMTNAYMTGACIDVDGGVLLP